MKRLLLTLSLICFSWGAGAYQQDNALSYTLEDFVPIGECLEAKINGMEWSTNIFMYNGFMFVFQTFDSPNNIRTTIRCDKKRLE